jgi:hypothetical protein
MRTVDGGWLLAAVLRAARATFGALPPGEYCGYALYSDDGAMTVCCAVNTAEHLARAVAADPGDADYWRWSPAEWAMEGIGDEHFAEICRWLRAAVAQTSGPAFVAFRDMVHETCVAALETLVADGEFGAGPVVVFAVSDTDDPARDAAWIRRLNPADQADRFARWVGAAEAADGNR